MDLLERLPGTGSPWMLLLIGVISFGLAFIGSSVGLILGHLRLPLLIQYLGSAPAGAACNLLVSGVGAMSGTVRHLIGGRVSVSCLVLMGLPSVVGAALAAFLFTRHVSHVYAYFVIGVMLVVSGINLLWKTDTDKPNGPTATPNVLLEILIGLGLGALAAVTGLMLGSLRLPMMIKWLRIDPRVAVGSNMAIGCMTALVAATTSFFSAENLEWGAIQQALLVLAPPTILGGYMGSWITGRLRKETVQTLAGWIIVVTGVLMTYESVREAARKPTAEVFDFMEEDDPMSADGDDD